jgi:hypothetical protein
MKPLARSRPPQRSLVVGSSAQPLIGRISLASLVLALGAYLVHEDVPLEFQLQLRFCTRAGNLSCSRVLPVKERCGPGTFMSTRTILIIILVLLLIGALPAWPYSAAWGFYPSGGLGLILLIVLVLLLLGRL